LRRCRVLERVDTFFGELGDGALGAAEVPGSANELLEDVFLEFALGHDLVAEAGFHGFVLVMLAVVDDEDAGAEAVLDGIEARALLAFRGARAGGAAGFLVFHLEKPFVEIERGPEWAPSISKRSGEGLGIHLKYFGTC